ncbi:hypothetical protein [Vitiosangium sp. GDMCC 1.1324]|uniref:hypothetical protein n=1 Tax=Vitiosangium sp. (strain GDMCC 1.1324) TaxID=2138576 RepID=UPI000D368081|nr:hypothetical protein [Vitiosangium sp. GDMCC 1.1324]PTL79858.1 hypothetical protein DAT35_30950 [Vitiosangium sp. GDMCC 1.1324]
MRSRTVLAGLTVATLALGARAAEDSTPSKLKAAEEKATPGDQFTNKDAGVVKGTVKGATGNVITLDVGRKEPLVQVIVKDEHAVPIVQEGQRQPLALQQLREGMPVRTHFRNEGGVRVATSIEVLEPAKVQGQKR